MRKLTLTSLTAALLLLTACTDSDQLEGSGTLTQGEETPENAITFATNVGRTKQTRAGETGSLNTLENLKKTQGFGVFAYYTGTQDYNTWTSYPTAEGTFNHTTKTGKEANFMFNQQVKWENSGHTGEIGATDTGGRWTYSPIKYWPNEVQVGGVDDQDNDSGSDPATTGYSNGGNVSFFAYAPYVSFELTGQDGIIKINEKTTNTGEGRSSEWSGDPIITYVVPADGSKMVDLLWGTKGATDVNVLGSNNIGVTGTGTWGDGYKGHVLKDQTTNADLNKQKTNGKIEFNFKHALAKVGGSTTGTGKTNGLMVVLDLDDMKGHEQGGNYNNDETIVTITDIQIVSRAKVEITKDGDKAKAYMKKAQGDFNLATGQWQLDKTTGNTTATTDGDEAKTSHNIVSEGVSTISPYAATLNTNIAEPAGMTGAGSSEKWSTLTTKLTNTNGHGVTNTAKNVYKEETNPLVFIPGTFPELTITVNYTVRTKDVQLKNYYTEVKQIITKKLTFTDSVSLNKQYNILMHLGLTNVKFTATVDEWDVNDADPKNFNQDDTPGDDIHVEEVYLPQNVGGETTDAFSADPLNITVPAGTTQYDVTLTGLTNATYTVTKTAEGGDFTAITKITDGGSEDVTSFTISGTTEKTLTVQVPANTKATAKKYQFKVNNGTTEKTITITQTGVMKATTSAYTLGSQKTASATTNKTGAVELKEGDGTAITISSDVKFIPNASWLSVNSSGKIIVTEDNLSVNDRVGIITVNYKNATCTLAVTQKGVTPSSLTDVSAVDASNASVTLTELPAAAGTYTFKAKLKVKHTNADGIPESTVLEDALDTSDITLSTGTAVEGWTFTKNQLETTENTTATERKNAAAITVTYKSSAITTTIAAKGLKQLRTPAP